MVKNGQKSGSKSEDLDKIEARRVELRNYSGVAGLCGRPLDACAHCRESCGGGSWELNGRHSKPARRLADDQQE